MVFYIPALSAGIIIAGFWKWLFHINGVVNWALGTSIAWFAQGATALPVIAAIVVTGNLGGTLIMTLASVEAVDPGMLDAARIDGASWRQIKRKIVLPTVSPTLALIALLGWINAWQIIETPMMLAPQDFAATLTYHIYRQGFLFGNYGMASAQAVILLFIIGGLALAKRRIER
jgi:multiple sugar transport system permease protein